VARGPIYPLYVKSIERSDLATRERGRETMRRRVRIPFAFPRGLAQLPPLMPAAY